MNFWTKFFAIVVFIGLGSCVGDVDFDQVDDLELTPNVVTPILNFEIDQSEFPGLDVNVVGASVLDIEDELNLPSLENATIQEHLDRLVFELQWENTFDGTFTLSITLLENVNAVNDVTYTFDDVIINPNEVGSQIFEIDIISNPNILNSTRVRGEIDYTGNLDQNNPGILIFKSTGTFELSIE